MGVWRGYEPCICHLPGGAGSQGCLRQRDVVVQLQPSWHKEFTFFWQKKKDEILKAWLKGWNIYIYLFFFPLSEEGFCSEVLQCGSETAAGQSRRDASHQERAGSGAEVREEEEACLGWADLGVNADTSTPP